MQQLDLFHDRDTLCQAENAFKGLLDVFSAPWLTPEAKQIAFERLCYELGKKQGQP